MRYRISFTNKYDREIKYLSQLINDNLESDDRSCEIVTSNELNKFNTPQEIDYIFKINGAEFSRLKFISQNIMVDDSISYETQEIQDIKVDKFIDDIMVKLPVLFTK